MTNNTTRTITKLFPNGNVMVTAKLVNGVKQGMWTVFKPDNAGVSRTRLYKDGQVQISKEYFDDVDVVNIVKRYTNGIISKVYKFHKNGKLQIVTDTQQTSESNYYIMSFDKNGSLISKIYYKNPKIDVEYFKDDQVVLRVKFKNQN